MIERLSKSLEMRISIKEYNNIFSNLNNYYLKNKYFPYNVFKDGMSNHVIKDELDGYLTDYIKASTSAVASDFNKGRKLSITLGKIKQMYLGVLPFNIGASYSLEILMSLFSDCEGIFDDLEFRLLDSKLQYLKKYIVLLLYISSLKDKEISEKVLIEALQRDTYDMLEIEVGVFINDRKGK